MPPIKDKMGVPTNRLVLGKHSGRHALLARLEGLGYRIEPAQLNDIYKRFTDLADRKKLVYDEDIVALVDDEIVSSHERIKVVELTVVAGTKGPQKAALTLDIDGEAKTCQSTGNGPVDAVFKAIESEIGSGAELLLYSVNAITTGTESQGEVTVRLSRGGRIVNGVGADPDIVVASAKAYIGALNKLQAKQERVNPQA